MTTKNLFAYILLLLPLSAFAEYNGHQIEFIIETTDGREIHGYNYLAMVSIQDESLSYQEYLEANFEIVLNNHFNDSVGTHAYFQHRIKYNFTNLYGGTGFIYTLTDKRSIDTNKVKSFKIIGLTDQSYAVGISTGHDYKDRIWMAGEPLEKYGFGGTFCSHDIFLHETNRETDRIIAELQKVSDDFEKELKELNEEMRSSDGAAHWEAEEKIDNLEEEIDEKISNVLQNFSGMKVVIITMCTC